ncbi:MAG: TlpA family protein disulfide reductase, partial [Candidatus Symbiothrix sp.]|nr:TlpA family protein disulfide reductase [Candidatus Symbiothrix sp.]
MKKTEYLFLLFLFNIVSGFGQDKLIQLQLEGKTYANLYVKTTHLYNKKTKIDGQFIGENKWVFTIPDSISKEICFVEFRYKQKDDKIEDFRALGFLGMIEGGIFKNYYVNFDNNSDTILLKGKFSKTETSEDFATFENDSTGIRHLYEDFYEVNPQANKYLMERMKDPFFSFFYDPNNQDKKYEEFIAEYISKIKENPESIYYITNLAETVSRYQFPNDIKKLYDHFSPAIKNSYFGKELYKYFTSKELFLDSKFENIALPLWDTSILNPIIQDTSKFNLIIFTAWWCKPCREEIPLLKEIYNDLKEYLPMTYVSIDEPETIAAWRELMRQENIPWRSLLAADEIKRIKEKYYVEGIPYTLLIYPDGSMEIMDIRNDEQRQKLYSLC